MNITLAAVQMECGANVDANRDKAERMVREAAAAGAQVILLPELFETPYFCKVQDAVWFERAQSWEEHPMRARFEALAQELHVVLPISFFERGGQAFFNAVAVIDATGKTLGIYRKTHIPQGPGYEEKFYFSPGDTGPRVWRTAYGCVGVGICWDQWFPELARAMVLMGADMLLYPTAIGTEPQHPEMDTSEHWLQTQRGHAGANMVPVAAANRVGTEWQRGETLSFYGSSFIAGPRAELCALAGREGETIISRTFDLRRFAHERAEWGLFRDRRPECYERLRGY